MERKAITFSRLGKYSAPFVAFFTAVVVVQGIHVFEHIIQVIQVMVLDVPEDDALGLLGYVFEFQGTEEWLHLVFNATYLIPLLILILPLAKRVPWPVPTWAFVVFLTGGVSLEIWHVAEHGVIISNVLANNGCPCPGILDSRLGIGDSVLHFFYNTLTYIGILFAFWYVIKEAPRGTGLIPSRGI